MWWRQDELFRCCSLVLNRRVFCIQGRSRQDYVNRLTADLCEYYGYNEFMMEKLLAIFGTKEVCGRTHPPVDTHSTWNYVLTSYFCILHTAPQG